MGTPVSGLTAEVESYLCAGIGIASMTVNDDGDLIITYSNGSIVNAGNIIDKAVAEALAEVAELYYKKTETYSAEEIDQKIKDMELASGAADMIAADYDPDGVVKTAGGIVAYSDSAHAGILDQIRITENEIREDMATAHTDLQAAIDTNAADIDALTEGTTPVAKATEADSATSAETAGTADKLSVSAGSSVKPVYFSNGVPVAVSQHLTASLSGTTLTITVN